MFKTRNSKEKFIKINIKIIEFLSFSLQNVNKTFYLKPLSIT